MLPSKPASWVELRQRRFCRCVRHAARSARSSVAEMNEMCIWHGSHVTCHMSHVERHGARFAWTTAYQTLQGEESMTVRVEGAGPVTTGIVRRPELRDAVDRATAEAMAAAFRAFEADPEAKVGVLWGEGGHFSAGADLRAIAAGAPNRTDPQGDGPMGPTRMLLGKPVVAALSGYAVAGGLELALWCDLRVMEEDAGLGVFCRRWGVPLIDGGTVRLPRLGGRGRALGPLLTGQ